MSKPQSCPLCARPAYHDERKLCPKCNRHVCPKCFARERCLHCVPAERLAGKEGRK